MAEQAEGSGLVYFSALHSLVDEGFWHRLSSLKLNHLGIDESPIPVTGFYAPCSHAMVSNNLTILSESLPSENGGQPQKGLGNRNRCAVPGTLLNTNTLEGFYALDKRSLLKAEAKKVGQFDTHHIWDDICSGAAENDCSLLSRFLLISYADLKKWRFHYWFASPALVLDPPARLPSMMPASKWFSAEQIESVSAACSSWRNSSNTADVPFFILRVDSSSHATIMHLSEWETCKHDVDKLLFGFYDPSHYPIKSGWPLRNFLAFLYLRWNLNSIHFFCYRETRGFPDMGLSLIGVAEIPVQQEWIDLKDGPKAVGWERDNNKAAPKSVTLAMSMDPIMLAVSAADLNLKLMRWRALPSLNLNILSPLKCLLLGAGTLGCEVARLLMAWGIRKITLVDSGRVSMSNPLRQSLYGFDDCLNGGEYKAVAAENSLKRIFPAVEAKGIVMSIPMPGHPVSAHEEKNVLDDCRHLHDLVDSHDVIFLLTDTRESRWLPTLLSSSSNKIVINAALGFDSFLVMRHGAGPLGSMIELTEVLPSTMSSMSIEDQTARQRLGCYFCNDVVAPIDSMSNRTLDQQCTVTRPGLAPMASAFAVELLVGLLHHPLGMHAQGEVSSSNGITNSDQPLGILPHQIRGSLYHCSQMTLIGHASNSCTACSSSVVTEYRNKGTEFLLQAINHPTYLEDLTGLTELMKSASSFPVDWDEAAEDDDEEGIKI
ncbi:hypothetical protein V2J09_019489 [Rumex salicifolius]